MLIPLLAAAAMQASQVTTDRAAVTVATEIFAEQTRVTADGRKQVVLEKPSKVAPGDMLIFVTTIRNGGGQPARDMVVNNPLPAPLDFVSSAEPGTMVSADGRTFSALAVLKVGDAGGQRAARASDVRVVRWTIGTLAPGQTLTRRFRAQIR